MYEEEGDDQPVLEVFVKPQIFVFLYIHSRRSLQSQGQKFLSSQGPNENIFVSRVSKKTIFEVTLQKVSETQNRNFLDIHVNTSSVQVPWMQLIFNRIKKGERQR